MGQSDNGIFAERMLVGRSDGIIEGIFDGNLDGSFEGFDEGTIVG